MSKELAGVRADNKYSYRKLESIAAYVRQELKFTPDQAIDSLRLFEDLHAISITKVTGKQFLCVAVSSQWRIPRAIHATTAKSFIVSPEGGPGLIRPIPWAIRTCYLRQPETESSSWAVPESAGS